MELGRSGRPMMMSAGAGAARRTGSSTTIAKNSAALTWGRGGLLSLEEACSRYTLTGDEFLSWQHSIDQHGLAGLRSTRTQQYRQK